MASNVIFMGWNYAIPGRERIAGEHFQEFAQHLGDLQQKGVIQSFDVVLLDAHGGDLNGFFLIRGDGTKLDALMQTGEWVTHNIRAGLHQVGFGVVRGVTGDQVMERMKLWTSLIPK